jgi:hypothetical protein
MIEQFSVGLHTKLTFFTAHTCSGKAMLPSE